MMKSSSFDNVWALSHSDKDAHFVRYMILTRDKEVNHSDLMCVILAIAHITSTYVSFARLRSLDDNVQFAVAHYDRYRDDMIHKRRSCYSLGHIILSSLVLPSERNSQLVFPLRVDYAQCIQLVRYRSSYRVELR